MSHDGVSYGMGFVPIFQEPWVIESRHLCMQSYWQYITRRWAGIGTYACSNIGNCRCTVMGTYACCRIGNIVVGGLVCRLISQLI